MIEKVALDKADGVTFRYTITRHDEAADPNIIVIATDIDKDELVISRKMLPRFIKALEAVAKEPR